MTPDLSTFPSQLFFSPLLRLGHQIRRNSLRRHRAPLHSLEGPTTTTLCVLHPPRSRRGLGPRARPQFSYQQTKSIRNSFWVERSPALRWRTRKTGPTRLDIRAFRWKDVAHSPVLFKRHLGYPLLTPKSREKPSDRLVSGLPPFSYPFFVYSL